MYKDLKILCIIPARGGSKGVPKKNIKLLGAHPLLSYSIAAANTSNLINRVVVSTDCEETAKITLNYKAEIPFMRPDVLSNDTSTDIDFILHALDYLESNEDYIPDLVVLLRPTTPLREIEYIDKAIETILLNKEASSLRSSHLCSESPFKWFSLDEEYYKPISAEYTLEDTGKPRQSFPSTYIPNGYIDIVIPIKLRKTKSLFGNKILSFITPITSEIDTLEEFDYLEYKVNTTKSSLLKYLNKKEFNYA